MPAIPPVPPTHDDLVKRSEGWLHKIGCGVTFAGLVASSTTGEIPDAIGWRSAGQISILIECKISRSDFFADRQKRFRAQPELGMGDYRFYMSPPGIIEKGDLPPGWGLLYYTPRMTKVVCGLPPNSRWGNEAPFVGFKQAEMAMMISALRRLHLRGVLPLIYEGIMTHPEHAVSGAADEPPMTVERLTELVGGAPS